ncbi:MAG: hypothetical protein AAB618_01265 [Patescibacteria group bacterium]
MTNHAKNSIINEMGEFAGFLPREQRYIKRSIDVAQKSSDVFEVWSRDEVEKCSIRAQGRLYAKLEPLIELIPSNSGLDKVDAFMAPLIPVSAFDLGQDQLRSFRSYRFLYERLLSARVRPWLPSAFCAAASLPHLQPNKRRDLLQSISEAAATAPGWSTKEPTFFPEWVDKVEA